jgi:hypothetical protein
MSKTHRSLYIVHPSGTGHERIILVEQYEPGYRKVCVAMLNL